MRKASCARPASTSRRASAHQSEPGGPAQPDHHRQDSGDQQNDPSQIGAADRCGIDAPLRALFPNIYPPCSDGYRDGGCWDQSGSSSDGGGGAYVEQERQQHPRAATLRRPLSTCALSLTNSWPRSTARYPTAQANELARRHGLAAPGIAEFPADRQHHQPVPHRRPPLGGDGEPRTCRRRQRSLGAAELPLCPAGPEGGLDRGRSRTICGRETSIAGGA